MLFRAVFWIGLVSVMMPREPDLGYGRPAAADTITSGLAGWVHSRISGTPASAGEVISLQVPERSLAQVKAEITAALHPS